MDGIRRQSGQVRGSGTHASASGDTGTKMPSQVEAAETGVRVSPSTYSLSSLFLFSKHEPAATFRHGQL